MPSNVSEETKRKIYDFILKGCDKEAFYEYLNKQQYPDPNNPERYNEIPLERGISLASRYAEFQTNESVKGIKILTEHIAFLEKNIPPELLLKIKQSFGSVKVTSQLNEDAIKEKLENATSIFVDLSSWLDELKDNTIPEIQELLELNQVITDSIKDNMDNLIEDIEQKSEEVANFSTYLREIYSGKTEDTLSIEQIRRHWVANPTFWANVSNADILKNNALMIANHLNEYQKLLLVFYSLVKQYQIGDSYMTTDKQETLVADYIIDPKTRKPGLLLVFPKGLTRRWILQDFIPLSESEVFSEGGRDPLEREQPDHITEETKTSQADLSALHDLL